MIRNRLDMIVPGLLSAGGREERTSELRDVLGEVLGLGFRLGQWLSVQAPRSGDMLLCAVCAGC